MSEKQSSSPAMAFILDYLKEHGDTEYAKVREAAEEAGHAIYPIMYGRAKTLLGLISEDRRKRRSKKKPDAGGEGGPRRALRQGAPGGPVSEATATQLSDFLERFKELEQERDRYRAALMSVEKLLREALGDDD